MTMKTTSKYHVGGTHVHDLTKFSREFLRKEFGIDLNIPITFNGRLKRVLGRYSYNHSGSLSIELSKDLVMYNSQDMVLDVLKHELVHYALHTLGKPHRDGQPYFENTLKRLGVSSTMTINSVGLRNFYQCEKCGEKFSRARKLQVERYRSGCCRAELVYLGKMTSN